MHSQGNKQVSGSVDQKEKSCAVDIQGEISTRHSLKNSALVSLLDFILGSSFPRVTYSIDIH